MFLRFLPTSSFQGAGSFRSALEHLWLELAGAPLQQTLYGKPHASQYRFVESMLAGLAEHPLERFYMVGDNPVTVKRATALSPLTLERRE